MIERMAEVKRAQPARFSPKFRREKESNKDCLVMMVLRDAKETGRGEAKSNMQKDCPTKGLETNR